MKFASVEVDGDSASAFGSLVTVKLVPTVAIIERDGSGRDKVAAVIEGANVPAIVTKVEEAYKRINSATSSIATTSTATSTPTVTSTNTGPATEDPEKLDARLNALVKKEPVMLFMKGNPEQPRCGFSRQIVELLNQQRISFGSFDILSDNAVRVRYYQPTHPLVSFCHTEFLLIIFVLLSSPHVLLFITQTQFNLVFYSLSSDWWYRRVLRRSSIGPLILNYT